MNYERFKRELYGNIIRRREAAGKRIKLLERNSICGDEETVRLIRNFNMILYGRPDISVREDVLCVVWGEWEIRYLLYWGTEALYDRFRREGWQSIIPEIVFKMQTEQLIMRPVNFSHCRQQLVGAYYWRFGDIALVPHILLCEEEGDYETMICTRDAMGSGGLTEEFVLTNALLGSCALLPPRLYHGGDVRRFFDSRNSKAGVFMPGEEGEAVVINPRNRQEGLRGYRLTNVKGTGGAAALFYPGVKDRLAELLGGDYYVGFPGADEVALHPVKYRAPGEMKAAIQRFNALSGEKATLTNRVYRYCRSRRKLIEV